jgi:hypothetical protein
VEEAPNWSEAAHSFGQGRTEFRRSSQPKKHENTQSQYQRCHQAAVDLLWDAL